MVVGPIRNMSRTSRLTWKRGHSRIDRLAWGKTTDQLSQFHPFSLEIIQHGQVLRSSELDNVSKAIRDQFEGRCFLIAEQKSSPALYISAEPAFSFFTVLFALTRYRRIFAQLSMTLLHTSIPHCIPHMHACTRFIAHKHRNRRLLSFPCRGTSRIQLHTDAPPTRLDRVDYRKLLSRRLGRGGRGWIFHEGSSTCFRRQRFGSKATATVFTLFVAYLIYLSLTRTDVNPRLLSLLVSSTLTRPLGAWIRFQMTVNRTESH